MSGDNPFLALGLPVRPDISDDEVRAAWRRVAASAHPDLPGGGDPPRFAAAAAAYAELRTPFGRTEAYADQTAATSASRPVAATRARSAPTAAADTSPGQAPATTRQSRPAALAALHLWRVRRGRPGVLAIRTLIAAGLITGSIIVAGWQPATLALTVGVLTWLIRTIRYDLAPA